MKKKTQKRVILGIAIFLAFSMVASFTFGMVASTGILDANNLSGQATQANGTNSATNSADMLPILKERVASLKSNLAAKPGDPTIQTDLGNAYYDLGMALQASSPAEMKTDLLLAVENYQNVLKSKQDINVLVDMATAAFYSGNNDLAEASFKKALAEKPGYYLALYNYGIFLSEAKHDYAGAIKEWQAALASNPQGVDADNLKSLIAANQKLIKP